MQEPNPIAPKPGKTDNDPARNEDFDTKVMAFSSEEGKDLGDEEMNIQTYLERMYKREDREREMLQEYKDDPEMMGDLSQGQQRELNARLKVLDYNEETRELQAQYLANPDDPSIAAKYEERQNDLKEYRELMQDSEEFKDNPHMQRMKELEEDLDKAEGLEAKNGVKIQLAEEMREFKRDIAAQGDEGIDKVISFVERNKDNKVIKESGMMDTIELIKERRAGKEGGQDLEDELENGEVKPNGRATAGGVDSTDKGAEETARAEIAGSADDGKEGAVETVRLESQNVDRETALASAANSTPNQPQQEDRGAGLA